MSRRQELCRNFQRGRYRIPPSPYTAVWIRCSCSVSRPISERFRFCGLHVTLGSGWLPQLQVRRAVQVPARHLQPTAAAGEAQRLWIRRAVPAVSAAAAAAEAEPFRVRSAGRRFPATKRSWPREGSSSKPFSSIQFFIGREFLPFISIAVRVTGELLLLPALSK
jgi:hypothetical protein